MSPKSVRTNHDQTAAAELLSGPSGTEARVNAVRAKDIEALLIGYADDVATFDLVVPMSNVGKSAVRERLVAWFSSFVTPIEYAIEDVQLSISGNVAFDHHFTHVRGTNGSGQAVDMWFRETIGYEKIDGRWLITHQHSSVPFDMTTGKPQLQR